MSTGGVCGDGGGLLICDGSCRRSFHAGCVPAAFHPAPEDTPSTPWFCPDCRSGSIFSRQSSAAAYARKFMLEGGSCSCAVQFRGQKLFYTCSAFPCRQRRHCALCGHVDLEARRLRSCQAQVCATGLQERLCTLCGVQGNRPGRG